MCGIVDVLSKDITEDKIDHDDGQQPGAESALEALGQFFAKLDTEHEEHAEQAEKRP